MVTGNLGRRLGKTWPGQHCWAEKATSASRSCTAHQAEGTLAPEVQKSAVFIEQNVSQSYRTNSGDPAGVLRTGTFRAISAAAYPDHVYCPTEMAPDSVSSVYTFTISSWYRFITLKWSWPSQTKYLLQEHRYFIPFWGLTGIKTRPLVERKEGRPSSSWAKASRGPMYGWDNVSGTWCIMSVKTSGEALNLG